MFVFCIHVDTVKLFFPDLSSVLRSFSQVAYTPKLHRLSSLRGITQGLKKVYITQIKISHLNFS